MFFLVVLALLSCTEAQGLEHVFVQHGKDLHLDLEESAVIDKNTDLLWKFNSTNTIGKIIHERSAFFDSYEGRAEFGPNYSLLLKNVTHSDSGDYVAVVIGGKDHNVAGYKVTVQDPVSPVKLAVTPSSSDSCNFTVTCSTVDSYISNTLRCDAKNCSWMEEKSLNTTNDRFSLTVYLHEDFIICNHSNKVSWKQSKESKPYCETKSDSCHLSVTCSTTDDHISSTFTCDTRSCSKVEQEFESRCQFFSSITVYTEQDFIITCNHSNQVSWKQSKKEIKPYCETETNGVSICVVKIVVFAVGLIIMVFAVISVHLMEKIKKKE